MALFLATIGYTPQDVSPGAAGSMEIIESAGRLVLGGSEMTDKIRVAPTVVVATLADVTDSDLNDGYRSTATFRVTESLKGEAVAGNEIRVRQRSGPLPDGTRVLGSTEFNRSHSGDFLLFLSRSAYGARSQRQQSDDPYYALILVAYSVRNGQLFPIGDVTHPPTTLDEARTLAR